MRQARSMLGDRAALFIALGIFWAGVLSQRIIMAPLLGSSNIAEDLGITAASAGLLSSIYMPVYGLMQLPSGVLADASSPRRNLIVSCLLFILCASLFALAPVFPVAVGMRALVGISSGFMYLSILKICANWTSSRGFGIAAGYINAVASASLMLTLMLMPLLLTAADWRSASLIAVVPLLAMPLAMLVVHDRPKDAEAPAPVKSTRHALMDWRQSWRDIMAVVRLREFWFFAVIECLWIGFHTALLIWLPRYSFEVLNVPKELTGTFAAVTSAGALVGNLFFGWLYSRATRRVKRVVVVSCLLYIALAAILFLGGSTVNSNVVLLTVLIIAVGVLGGSPPIVVAALRDIMPRANLGTGMGVYNALVFLASFAYPWLVGAVMDIVDRPDSPTWVYTTGAYSWSFVAGLSTLIAAMVLACVFLRSHSRSRKLTA